MPENPSATQQSKCKTRCWLRENELRDLEKTHKGQNQQGEPQPWVTKDRALPIVELPRSDRPDDLRPASGQTRSCCLVAERRALALPFGIQVVHRSALVYSPFTQVLVGLLFAKRATGFFSVGGPPTTGQANARKTPGESPRGPWPNPRRHCNRLP
jgi:hypothetical protein